jgi:hypothetical protein
MPPHAPDLTNLLALWRSTYTLWVKTPKMDGHPSPPLRLTRLVVPSCYRSSGLLFFLFFGILIRGFCMFASTLLCVCIRQNETNKMSRKEFMVEQCVMSFYCANVPPLGSWPPSQPIHSMHSYS